MYFTIFIRAKIQKTFYLNIMVLKDKSFDISEYHLAKMRINWSILSPPISSKKKNSFTQPLLAKIHRLHSSQVLEETRFV